MPSLEIECSAACRDLVLWWEQEVAQHMIHMSLQQVVCALQLCWLQPFSVRKEFCICLLLKGWLQSSCCTTSVLCCPELLGGALQCWAQKLQFEWEWRSHCYLPNLKCCFGSESQCKSKGIFFFTIKVLISCTGQFYITCHFNITQFPNKSSVSNPVNQASLQWEL